MSREAFEKWFYSAPHRKKYDDTSPAYLAAHEAWQAALQSGEPVAWMHNTRKNVDVIGADVKHLFGSMAEFYGSHGVAHVDKGEHYTIPLYTTPQQVASATTGMNLGERIKHVGGRENAQGYIEFGSVMAVKALIDHVLRDLHTTPQPVVPEGSDAFLADVQAAIKTGDLVKADMLIQGFRVALLSAGKETGNAV
jgi:hypothetical protein